jgi:hypothetical protein
VSARSTCLLRALAAGIALVLSQAAMAIAAPPPAPLNLRVLGGQEAWHAENRLRLDWEETAPGIVAAVHLRVRDEAGAAVLESRIPSDPFQLDYIHVPRPGRYRAEVWLESGSGEQGPLAAANFLFDDARPGPVRLSLPAGWIGAGQVPLLRISHPSGPLPIAGIHGYAVSVDLDPGTGPCRSADVCTAPEVDLGGGIGDDSLPLRQLPEGTVQVRAVAVSGSGMRSALAASGLLHIDLSPPAVAVVGAPAGWVDRAVTVTVRATDARSGMESAGGGGPITALSIDGAVPAVAAGSTVSAEVAGEGIHLIRASARDAAGNRGDGGAVVGIDRTPPRLAFAAALDRTDPELLTATISDELSGPDPSRGVIAVRAARSHRQFSPLPTTVEGERLRARWDSDHYPPGQYEFVATAYDRAGNAGHGQLRPGGMPMLLPAPLKARSKLLAGFGGRSLVWHRCVKRELRRRCRREVIEAFEQRPAGRTVQYGRRVTVSGVLTAANGGPLAGQRVELVEVLGEDEDPPRRDQELTTAGDGSFLARLAPGPSRRIEFSFAGTRTMSEARARPATLTVQAGVKMRSSAEAAEVGGRPLIFSGVVADAAAIPAGGKAVELQFRLPGLPWSEFRSVRTDRQGRFRYPYRFSDDDSRGARFQFRAFVPAEAGWPYAAAASRPILVWGR